MKNNKFLYIFAGFVLGGLLFFGFFTFSDQRSKNILPKNNSGASNNSNVMDAHFIEQMIPHHEDAITMSELALEKAQRPEVKELAQNIIESQTKENEQMKNWYKEWFGRELPTGEQVMQNHGMMSGSNLHMGMMGSSADLEKLENAQDFDRAFVEHMIPHHQMAVMMASMLKNGSSRPEMRELADNIIAAQTEEIDMMREWLSEWE
jgi:uncharacterized protein (DUF305 family)